MTNGMCDKNLTYPSLTVPYKPYWVHSQIDVNGTIISVLPCPALVVFNATAEIGLATGILSRIITARSSD